MDYHKEIAKCLIYAQLASDEGKGCGKFLREHLPPSPFSYGYDGKDEAIFKAIQLSIRSKGDTGFKFRVERCSDTAPFLVYFTFKMNKEKYQMIFHSFDNRLELQLKKGKKKKDSIWMNHNSREAAMILAASLKLLN